MTKIISNLQLRPKRIPSKDLWQKLKGTNNFYWIEIVLIWLILLNPRFETQVTLITSYFLKKFTNYFIIAWYFCQKVLHNSFIYEAFWDIKVSFLHCSSELLSAGWLMLSVSRCQSVPGRSHVTSTSPWAPRVSDPGCQCRNRSWRCGEPNWTWCSWWCEAGDRRRAAGRRTCHWAFCTSQRKLMSSWWRDSCQGRQCSLTRGSHSYHCHHSHVLCVWE